MEAHWSRCASVVVDSQEYEHAYFIQRRRGRAHDARQRCEPPPASSGKVPAVLYGGHERAAQTLALDQQQLLTMIDDEKLLFVHRQLKIDAQAQQAIVKDVQMHPAQERWSCTSICSA